MKALEIDKDARHSSGRKAGHDCEAGLLPGAKQASGKEESPTHEVSLAAEDKETSMLLIVSYNDLGAAPANMQRRRFSTVKKRNAPSADCLTIVVADK
jgi:hypothetical protein